jgi:preprotein translocase subunit Sec61beta
METLEAGIFEYHDKMLLKEIMLKRSSVVPGAIAVMVLIYFKQC